MDGPADCLSRLDLGGSVEPRYDEKDFACTTVSAEDVLGLKPHLVSIATYLNGLSADHLDNETRRKTLQTCKTFVVCNGSFFRRVCGSLRLIRQKHVRRLIKTWYHDDIGSWDKKTPPNLFLTAFDGLRCVMKCAARSEHVKTAKE